MNLTIDIGNTRNKAALFDQNNLIKTDILTKLDERSVKEFILENNVDSVIVSSVKEVSSSFLDYLQSEFSLLIELSHQTSLPIENLYETKETLGKDRIAAVVGANNIFPETNVLVIDMGTAITFDIINQKSQYLGGTISPGLEMRFKALNQFTGKLPLLTKQENNNIIGKNTEQAIIAGVQNGIVFEVENYINYLKEKYENLKTILTGGDAIFFVKKLKNTIFVNQNLNFVGLNIILEHNKPNDK